MTIEIRDDFSGWADIALAAQPKQHRDSLVAAINKFYDGGNPAEHFNIPHPDSPERAQLSEFLGLFPDQPFRKAVFEGYAFPRYVKYSVSQSSNSKEIESARIVGQILRTGLLPTKIDFKELAQFYDSERGKLSSLLHETDASLSLRNEKLNELERNHAEFSDKAEAEFADMLKRKQVELEEALASTSSQLEEFKEKIRNATALKGPIEYWKGKAETHKARAASSLKQLLWAGIFSAAGFALLGYCFSEKFTVISQVNVLHSALLVVGITAWLWAIKTVLRNYLSNTHLMNDAEERLAMTQSYLALQESDSPLDRDALAPVLAALFRPAGDGIVKDESPPLALLELVGKANK